MNTLHFFKNRFQGDQPYFKSKELVHFYLDGEEKTEQLKRILPFFKEETVQKTLLSFFCEVLSNDNNIVPYFDQSTTKILQIFDDAGIDLSYLLDPSVLENCSTVPSQERWKRLFLPLVQNVLRNKYLQGMSDLPFPKELNATIRSLLMGSKNVREEEKLANSSLEQTRLMMGFKRKSKKSRKSSKTKKRSRKNSKKYKQKSKRGSKRGKKGSKRKSR